MTDARRLLALDIRLSETGADLIETALERGSRRALSSGVARARFHRGSIAFEHDGIPVTTHAHWHSECLVGNIWTFSHALNWDTVERQGDTLVMSGVAKRFPLRQTWILLPATQGFTFAMDFEVSEPLAIQEFNVTMGIVDAYTAWDTGLEQGVFPELAPDVTEWAHLNTNYGISPVIRARGSGVPTVSIHNTAENLPTRMTPMAGAKAEKTRLLQVLRVPGLKHTFQFEPGTHRVFECEIHFGE